jgi:guanylate kinase
MISKGEFLEYDAHMGNLYGTPKFQVDEKRKLGHMVLDIEPNVALNVKSIWPEAKLIFIAPPSMEELEKRLRGRGDTPEDQVQMRLKRATWEMSQREKYDLVVINDVARDCADRILNFIVETAKE